MCSRAATKAFSRSSIGVNSASRPTTAADFFDLEKFPGKRGLWRSPKHNLEFALIADGVPVDQIYNALSSEQGIQRAFAKLDTIKSEVVWWEAGALQDG